MRLQARDGSVASTGRLLYALLPAAAAAADAIVPPDFCKHLPLQRHPPCNPRRYRDNLSSLQRLVLFQFEHDDMGAWRCCILLHPVGWCWPVHLLRADGGHAWCLFEGDGAAGHGIVCECSLQCPVPAWEPRGVPGCKV